MADLSSLIKSAFQKPKVKKRTDAERGAQIKDIEKTFNVPDPAGDAIRGFADALMGRKKKKRTYE